MATRRNPNSQKQIIELGPSMSLRLEASDTRGLFTPGRGPGLLACLALSVVLFCTDGGGVAFYDAAYSQFRRTETFLVKSPEAPLAFLDPDGAAADRLQLHGIVYSTSRPIAVINEKALAPGEILSLKTGRSAEVVQCVGIEPDAVHLRSLDGVSRSLRLKPIEISQPETEQR